MGLRTSGLSYLLCFSVAVVRVLGGLSSVPALPQTGVDVVVVVVNVVVVVVAASAGCRQVGAKRVGHRSGDAQVGDQFVTLGAFVIVTKVGLIYRCCCRCRCRR